MKNYIIPLILFSFTTCLLHAQVGIGTTTPNASSSLEIASTNSGILIPRMTVANRIAIVAPAEGLLVYQTDDVEGFYYYDGTKWLNLLSPNSQIGVVPIGSIIAWHGSLTGVGALPDGWVLCQGGTTSGVYQSDQTNNLFRVIGNGTSGTLNTITLNNNGAISWIETDDHNSGTFGSDRYGFQLRGVENRVTNMRVIWIMRIK